MFLNWLWRHGPYAAQNTNHLPESLAVIDCCGKMFMQRSRVGWFMTGCLFSGDNAHSGSSILCVVGLDDYCGRKIDIGDSVGEIYFENGHTENGICSDWTTRVRWWGSWHSWHVIRRLPFSETRWLWARGAWMECAERFDYSVTELYCSFWFCLQKFSC